MDHIELLTIQRLTIPAMSKIFFSFDTNVANKYGHSPHFYNRDKISVNQLSFKLMKSYQFLSGKCEMKQKKTYIAFLKYWQTSLFATCGEWPMGWTSLNYTLWHTTNVICWFAIKTFLTPTGFLYKTNLLLRESQQLMYNVNVTIYKQLKTRARISSKC